MLKEFQGIVSKRRRTNGHCVFFLLAAAPPERRHSGQHFPAFLWLSVRFQGEGRPAKRVTLHNDAPLPTHNVFVAHTAGNRAAKMVLAKLLFRCNVPGVGDTHFRLQCDLEDSGTGEQASGCVFLVIPQ